MGSQEVKELSVTLRTRFTQRLRASVSAEGLSEEQLRQAQTYSKAAPGAGVLVGALLGEERWDVRPLVLEGSSLWIMRVTDPSLQLESEPLKIFGKLQADLIAAKVEGLRQQGQIDEQVWVKRRFHRGTLADSLVLATPDEPLLSLDQARRLLELLVRLEDRAFVHGNVCPANVAVEEGQVYLLDHLFSQTLSRQSGRQPLPEAAQVPAGATSFDSVISPKADSVAVAETLLAVGVRDLPPAQADLLVAALSNQTQSVRALFSSLFPNVRLAVVSPPAKVTSGPRQVSVSPLGSGKLITSVPSGGGAAAVSNSSEARALPSAPAARSSDTSRIEEKPRASASNAAVAGPRERPASVSAHATTMLSPQVVAQIRRRAGSGKVDNVLAWLRGMPATHAVLVFLALLLAALVLRQILWPPGADDAGTSGLPLEQYWTSDQVGLMREVAQVALGSGADAAEARELIVRDALTAAKRPQVRSDFLRFVFNPLWKAELHSADWNLALRLALAGLVEAPLANLPPIHKAHPALIVAVIGHARLELGLGAYREVELERLAQLPGEAGQALALLARSGLKNADSKPARALCHLLVGDGSAEVFTAYFDSGTETERIAPAALERLQILISFPALFSRFNAPLYEYLKAGSTVFGERARWFEAEQLAAWEGQSPAVRVALIAEQLPAQGLSTSQEFDLLLFPRLSLSAAGQSLTPPLAFSETLTARIVAGHVKMKGFESLLKFILAGQHALTRAQVITLLTALQMAGDDSLSMLDLFIQTAPDVESVLRILLLRKFLPANDPVNGELANYLARSEWNASLAELREMSTHRLQLARALAYARLDPLLKEHLQILNAAIAQESNPKLRADVLRKIQSAEDRGG